MPRTGELRDKVAFLKPTYAENRVGQEQITYATVGHGWAKWTDFGARDTSRFRQSGVKATAEVVIRLYRDIDNDWKVERNGKQYHVDSITHDGRRWTTLTVYQQRQ